MTDNLEQKLLEIVNKTIKHEGKLYNVQNFKENQRNVVVFTKQRSFVLQHQEVDAWLETIKIVEDNSIKHLPSTKQSYKPEKVSLKIYEPTDSQKEVQKSLLDMLKKVKEDPNAIPQAKAVCEIANTMVNMEKSQIQLMNLAKGR